MKTIGISKRISAPIIQNKKDDIMNHDNNKYQKLNHTEIDDDDDNQNFENETYLAIHYEKRKLGIAVFNACTTVLSFTQQEVTDEGIMDEILDQLKLQVDPNAIIISSRCAMQGSLYTLLKKKPFNSVGGSNYNIYARKHKEFNYERARNLIQNLLIGKIAHRENFCLDRYHASFFDFDQVQAIRAIGGLLSYLLNENIVNQLDENSRISIANVESIQLDGYMVIDPISLRSLQIFSVEDHPSKLKGSGRSKEGFSLFGIMNRTVTKPGRKMLRQWMLRPLMDLHEINSRHSVVNFFRGIIQSDFLKQLLVKLRGFGDVERIILRIKSVTWKCKDWLTLHESLRNFLSIQIILAEELRHYENTREKFPLILNEIMEIQRVRQCCNLIGNVLNLEESKNLGTCVIRDGISEDLDYMRDVYNKIDDLLSNLVKDVNTKYPELQSISAHYMHQVGFVFRWDSPNSLPEEFQYQFQENERTRYFKNPNCKLLDEDPGDVKSYIDDIQYGIMRHLSQTLLDSESGYEIDMHRMTSCLSRLDCLISFSKCASEYRYNLPVVIDNVGGLTKATKVRHPLQELTVDTFIPNDVNIGDDPNLGNGLLVITGQNGSGKSVYLKMVGLLVYMCQIGSFVPAESSEINIVSKIFTRIHSLETASLAQSSFTIDCNQISHMLNQSNPRSLLLIDEFGKGTRHIDGIALLTGTIKLLIERFIKEKGPIVVITTHFLEIFKLNLLEPYVSKKCVIGCYQMAMISSCTNEKDSNPVNSYLYMNPLFELKQGIADISNALRCASLSGIPKHVIERAEYVLRCGKTKKMITSISDIEIEIKRKKLMDYFYSITNYEKCSEDEINELFLLARDMDN